MKRKLIVTEKMRYDEFMERFKTDEEKKYDKDVATLMRLKKEGGNKDKIKEVESEIRDYFIDMIVYLAVGEGYKPGVIRRRIYSIFDKYFTKEQLKMYKEVSLDGRSLLSYVGELLIGLEEFIEKGD